MRLKNQYYCIFVFNNNYITGSSAYEGGYRKTDIKQERRTGFYPVRLSTLGPGVIIGSGKTQSYQWFTGCWNEALTISCPAGAFHISLIRKQPFHTPYSAYEYNSANLW